MVSWSMAALTSALSSVVSIACTMTGAGYVLFLPSSEGTSDEPSPAKGGQGLANGGAASVALGERSGSPGRCRRGSGGEQFGAGSIPFADGLVLVADQDGLLAAGCNEAINDGVLDFGEVSGFVDDDDRETSSDGEDERW
jgi:hypothetical protein